MQQNFQKNILSLRNTQIPFILCSFSEHFYARKCVFWYCILIGSIALIKLYVLINYPKMTLMIIIGAIYRNGLNLTILRKKELWTKITALCYFFYCPKTKHAYVFEQTSKTRRKF